MHNPVAQQHHDMNSFFMMRLLVDLSIYKILAIVLYAEQVLSYWMPAVFVN